VATQADSRLVAQRLQAAIKQEPALAEAKRPTELRASHDLIDLLHTADQEAKNLGDGYTSTEHILLAASKLELTDGIPDYDVIKGNLTQVRGNMNVQDDSPESKMKVLDKYGQDFTALAREGQLDPVIGRDEEIRRCMQVLSRRTKNNPVLIGEPGVGKTAIVEGLAQRIVA